MKVCLFCWRWPLYFVSWKLWNASIMLHVQNWSRHINSRTYIQRPLVYKDRLFLVPWVVFIYRFDCIFIMRASTCSLYDNTIIDWLLHFGTICRAVVVTQMIAVSTLLLVASAGIIASVYYMDCDPLVGGQISAGDQVRGIKWFIPLFIFELYMCVCPSVRVCVCAFVRACVWYYTFLQLKLIFLCHPVKSLWQITNNKLMANSLVYNFCSGLKLEQWKVDSTKLQLPMTASRRPRWETWGTTWPTERSTDGQREETVRQADRTDR